jgi:hypothetical protein
MSSAAAGNTLGLTVAAGEGISVGATVADEGAEGLAEGGLAQPATRTTVRAITRREAVRIGLLLSKPAALL